MSKMLKSIMINKITKFGGKNLLLLESQMSDRKKKEIETFLKMLIQKIHKYESRKKTKLSQ